MEGFQNRDQLIMSDYDTIMAGFRLRLQEWKGPVERIMNNGFLTGESWNYDFLL